MAVYGAIRTMNIRENKINQTNEAGQRRCLYNWEYISKEKQKK